MLTKPSIIVVVALLFSAVAHAQQPGESFHDCPHCPEMVMLPAGEFMMGSADSEGNLVLGINIEGPRHKVTISRSFAVGKYEVTNEEYLAFIKANPASRNSRARRDGLFNIDPPVNHPPGLKDPARGKNPVVGVGWPEAKKYVAWLSKETGHAYRLLSESEWEYAARAGTKTRYFWGDNFDAAKFAYGGDSVGFRTVPVGGFAANNFGLHDMLGNVSEWVEDCWNSNYNGAPSDEQAWLSGNCGQRVIRGGYAANRNRGSAGTVNNVFSRLALGNVGIRVARMN